MKNQELEHPVVQEEPQEFDISIIEDMLDRQFNDDEDLDIDYSEMMQKVQF